MDCSSSNGEGGQHSKEERNEEKQVVMPHQHGAIGDADEVVGRGVEDPWRDDSDDGNYKEGDSEDEEPYNGPCVRCKSALKKTEHFACEPCLAQIVKENEEKRREEMEKAREKGARKEDELTSPPVENSTSATQLMAGKSDVCTRPAPFALAPSRSRMDQGEDDGQNGDDVDVTQENPKEIEELDKAEDDEVDEKKELCTGNTRGDPEKNGEDRADDELRSTEHEGSLDAEHGTEDFASNTAGRGIDSRQIGPELFRVFPDAPLLPSPSKPSRLLSIHEAAPLTSKNGNRKRAGGATHSCHTMITRARSTGTNSSVHSGSSSISRNGSVASKIDRNWTMRSSCSSDYTAPPDCSNRRITRSTTKSSPGTIIANEDKPVINPSTMQERRWTRSMSKASSIVIAANEENPDVTPSTMQERRWTRSITAKSSTTSSTRSSRGNAPSGSIPASARKGGKSSHRPTVKERLGFNEHLTWLRSGTERCKTRHQVPIGTNRKAMNAPKKKALEKRGPAIVSPLHEVAIEDEQLLRAPPRRLEVKKDTTTRRNSAMEKPSSSSSSAIVQHDSLVDNPMPPVGMTEQKKTARRKKRMDLYSSMQDAVSMSAIVEQGEEEREKDDEEERLQLEEKKKAKEDETAGEKTIRIANENKARRRGEEKNKKKKRMCLERIEESRGEHGTHGAAHAGESNTDADVKDTDDESDRRTVDRAKKLNTDHQWSAFRRRIYGILPQVLLSGWQQLRKQLKAVCTENENLERRLDKLRPLKRQLILLHSIMRLRHCFWIEDDFRSVDVVGLARFIALPYASPINELALPSGVWCPIFEEQHVLEAPRRLVRRQLSEFVGFATAALANPHDSSLQILRKCLAPFTTNSRRRRREYTVLPPYEDAMCTSKYDLEREVCPRAFYLAARFFWTPEYALPDEQPWESQCDKIWAMFLMATRRTTACFMTALSARQLYLTFVLIRMIPPNVDVDICFRAPRQICDYLYSVKEKNPVARENELPEKLLVLAKVQRVARVRSAAIFDLERDGVMRTLLNMWRDLPASIDRDALLEIPAVELPDFFSLFCEEHNDLKRRLDAVLGPDDSSTVMSMGRDRLLKRILQGKAGTQDANNRATFHPSSSLSYSLTDQVAPLSQNANVELYMELLQKTKDLHFPTPTKHMIRALQVVQMSPTFATRWRFNPRQHEDFLELDDHFGYYRDFEDMNASVEAARLRNSGCVKGRRRSRSTGDLRDDATVESHGEWCAYVRSLDHPLTSMETNGAAFSDIFEAKRKSEYYRPLPVVDIFDSKLHDIDPKSGLPLSSICDFLVAHDPKSHLMPNKGMCRVINMHNDRVLAREAAQRNAVIAQVKADGSHQQQEPQNVQPNQLPSDPSNRAAPLPADHLQAQPPRNWKRRPARPSVPTTIPYAVRSSGRKQIRQLHPDPSNRAAPLLADQLQAHPQQNGQHQNSRRVCPSELTMQQDASPLTDRQQPLVLTHYPSNRVVPLSADQLLSQQQLIRQSLPARASEPAVLPETIRSIGHQRPRELPHEIPKYRVNRLPVYWLQTQPQLIRQLHSALPSEPTSQPKMILSTTRQQQLQPSSSSVVQQRSQLQEEQSDEEANFLSIDWCVPKRG